LRASWLTASAPLHTVIVDPLAADHKVRKVPFLRTVSSSFALSARTR